MNKPNKFIIHHSATDGGTLESIKRYHIENNGWNDIGYHYLITTDGKIHKGRGDDVTGAHTLGENNTSIGICLVGNFDAYKPSSLLIEVLIDKLIELRKEYGKLPIYGHKDFSYKTCPGKMFPLNLIIEEIERKEKGVDAMKEMKIEINKIQSSLDALKRLTDVKQDVKTEVVLPKTEHFKVATTDYVEIHPLNLYAEVVKQAGNKISGDFVNGTFFGTSNGNLVSVGNLVSDGKVLANALPHDNVKRGTLIVYKDGSVDVEMIDFIANHPKLSDIHFAIGGFNMFPLNHKAEWYPDDVVRQTMRTSIGYNPVKNKIIIAVRPDSTAERGKQTLTNLGCTIGIGLDSGGSTNARMDGKNVILTSRVLHNILRWKK